MTGRAGPRFTGSRVLVTGGAHGIGRACASRLAEEGARLAVADLDLDAAGEAVETIEGVVEDAHLAIGMDATDSSSAASAVAEAAARLGGLDVLINVAGGDTPHGSFLETDDEVWARMFELNLLGVVRCCRAAVPHLRRSTKSPSIVTVTSINGLTAMGSEPYSAAKAGAGSLTANLAMSLAGDGIRVNAVAPATIRTRVWDGQEGYSACRRAPAEPLSSAVPEHRGIGAPAANPIVDRRAGRTQHADRSAECAGFR